MYSSKISQSLLAPTVCLEDRGESDRLVHEFSIKRRERWTEQEHENFLKGLEIHGRKWKKIQAYVKSKTPIQVGGSDPYLERVK